MNRHSVFLQEGATNSPLQAELIDRIDFTTAIHAEDPWLTCIAATRVALAAQGITFPRLEHEHWSGKDIYDSLCLACHGEDGQGGHAEGGAIPRDATIEHLFTTATRGGEKMVPFGDAFTPAELKSVAAYVKESVLTRDAAE